MAVIARKVICGIPMALHDGRNSVEQRYEFSAGSRVYRFPTLEAAQAKATELRGKSTKSYTRYRIFDSWGDDSIDLSKWG